MIKRGYNKNEVQRQILNTNTIEKTQLLNRENRRTSKQNSANILTQDRTLPDIKKSINKHCKF